jgi:hypothetical protein
MKIKVFILKKFKKKLSNSTLKKVSFQLLSSFIQQQRCVWRIWHVPDIDNHDTTCSTSPTAANTQATGRRNMLNLFIIDRQPFINFFNLFSHTIFLKNFIKLSLKTQKLREFFRATWLCDSLILILIHIYKCRMVLFNSIEVSIEKYYH